MVMFPLSAEGIIPQQGLAGDMRISYSKFLELLENDRVKRVIVYGDMKTAIVEVPHPWYASIVGAPGAYPFAEDRDGKPISLLVPDPSQPDNPLAWYCPEMPEWNMEKYRFYVDLPGDFWDRGALLRYLRSKDVKVSVFMRVSCGACFMLWIGSVRVIVAFYPQQHCAVQHAHTLLA